MAWKVFRHAYAQPGRRSALIAELERLIDVLAPVAVVESLLVGGSFLDGRVRAPKDIDCGVFYRAVAGDAAPSGGLAAALGEAVRVARPRGVDARLVPVDAGAEVLIRMSAFLTNLYLAERPAAAGAGRGLLLVSMTREG
ncbi:hypothetical protein ABE85_15625 [Mitsuaria sp. 7]|nr:hypothetical protein ABE85_15625 [Mitsuaria sp. 7]